MLFRINSNHLCLHNFGEESCSVTMPRPFKFQTGRADCVEVDPSLKCISPQAKSILLDLFPRETRSLGTRRRRQRFTQTLLETAVPQSSSSATPLPWRGGRCCSRHNFQLQSYPNLNKVVALMGAHTFGKPHFEISMFPYTWTRSSFLKYIISSNIIPARASTCGTMTTTKPSLDDQGYFGKCLVHISWLSADGSSPLTLAPLVTKWAMPLETSPSE